MNEVIDQIKDKLTGDFISDYFPMATTHGIPDRQVLLHSMGCSIWNKLGHELGFSAMVECPAPSGCGNEIRSDSAWFPLQCSTPVVLVEFERYDGSDGDKQKLDEKLSNLMEAASQVVHCGVNCADRLERRCRICSEHH